MSEAADDLPSPRVALNRAIKKAGSAALLADVLGVTRQAVTAWKKKGMCPMSRAAAIEKATKVPRAALRPDIYL